MICIYTIIIYNVPLYYMYYVTRGMHRHRCHCVLVLLLLSLYPYNKRMLAFLGCVSLICGLVQSTYLYIVYRYISPSLFKDIIYY